MAENKEELKSLLMNMKEESEKNWLETQHSKNEDHGIWSHHFMANKWGYVETYFTSKISKNRLSTYLKD